MRGTCSVCLHRTKHAADHDHTGMNKGTLMIRMNRNVEGIDQIRDRAPSKSI